jgi:hypothetical protein
MQEKCDNCHCCVERVIGDIIVAMIKNGDMDQSDSTFERRLRHTREAAAGIYEEFAGARQVLKKGEN